LQKGEVSEDVLWSPLDGREEKGTHAAVELGVVGDLGVLSPNNLDRREKERPATRSENENF
jgi:hypothetical protein